ncbi:MAG: gliding motility lipoprotein GldH [Cyclobacteriaceae bacterium]|nr:gliding motility lipoprotein GldH [Cyclobacteriaceae bacterium]
MIKGTTMSNRIIAGLILLLAFTSCGDERVYEDFQKLPSQGWSAQDSLIFEIGELPESFGQNLIGVRFKEDYPYANIYIRLITQDSSLQTLENQLINLTLFDIDGEPMGEGFGSTYTLYDTLPFKIQAGTKQVILLQYMREAELKGIEAIGLKILK